MTVLEEMRLSCDPESETELLPGREKPEKSNEINKKRLKRDGQKSLKPAARVAFFVVFVCIKSQLLPALLFSVVSVSVRIPPPTVI